MIKKLLFVMLIALFPTLTIAAETVAKVRTSEWDISVIAEGTSWENSCKLKLRASQSKNKKEISIKREETGCLLRGPVHLQVSESADNQTAIIFLEADRGDDSYHSGPIVEVIKLNKVGMKKLGEQQLFDATYIRENGQITNVIGKALFSLCSTCEYPVSLNPGDNFFIPVKLTTGKGSISVDTTLSAQERKNLMAKFEARVRTGAKENQDISDQSYQEFVSEVRHKIRSLLKQ